MSGLEVSSLAVTYGGNRPTPAVHDASFTVAIGETVSILGPSGCGKSTVLAAIAGTIPSRGSVSWNGENVASTPVHERGFGLVFQDGFLFPHRDVAGNVAFGLEMAGRRRAERDARVDAMLELVGLAGFRKRRINELSGGERQRVALARALAPEPRLLMLDEPLSSLDRELRDRLAIDLREILTRTGTTGILVTHDREEAATIADRTLLMREGVVPAANLG